MASKLEQKSTLTQAELKEYVTYNPETGDMIWKERTRENGGSQYKSWNTKYAGKNCGYTIKPGVDSPHLVCRFKKFPFQVHRLAYLYMTGKWADGEIDHINGQRADNRWVNLRVVTSQQNNWNRGPLKNNKTGVRGVWYNPKSEKYQAYLEISKFKHNLGWYKDLDMAIDARTKAALKYYGDYAYESRDKVINESQNTSKPAAGSGEEDA